MIRSDLEDIERLEQLEEIIIELKDLAMQGAVIVVEGRKDERTLRCLGIDGMIRLASQQPLLSLIESLSGTGKKIIILTDWDKKGSLIAKKLVNNLIAYGIVPDTEIRSRLRSLSKKRIKDVESLDTYMDKLRYEIHGITKF